MVVTTGTAADARFRRQHRLSLKSDFTQRKLKFGDTLLMEGPVEAINKLMESGEFVRISEAPEVPFDPRKVWVGVGIAAAFVLGASFQVLPPSNDWDTTTS